MRKTWDPETPSLHPTIICYADILGFRDMTKSAVQSGKETEFLQRIKHSIDTAYDRMRRLATLDGTVPCIFHMKLFTDNIVVAHPLRDPSRDRGEPELGTLLMLFGEVQASLAADGFFLRGAIAAGQHYQDDDIVYGKALFEAVDLDKSGSSPRLVIAPSVEPLILEHLSWYGAGWAPHHHELLEDPRDGRLFVNYLGGAFANFPDCPIDYPLLTAHSRKVRKRLQEFASNEGILSKYEWLATYHNYACRTFAEQYLVEGNEEADPERMAYSDEAQRALDHLVHFETQSDEQLPLLLDAQRLQERLTTTKTSPTV